MLVDTTEFFPPPRPAFFDEACSFIRPTNISRSSDSHVELLQKRRAGRRFGSSISSIFSCYSKASSTSRLSSGEDETKGSIIGSDGSSSRSSTSHQALSRSFLTRISTVFHKPSASSYSPVRSPLNGGNDQYITLTTPPSQDRLSSATKLKEEWEIQVAHLSRLLNFRFGRGRNDSLGVESTSNLLLLSPSQGLFESLNSPSSCPPTLLTIAPPSSNLSPNISTPMLHDPDLNYFFPIPSPLSPLLSPLMDHEPSHPVPTNIPLPPTPIPSDDTPNFWVCQRANRLTLLAMGLSDGVEDLLISPSLTRSYSLTDSDDELPVSTPTLLESALCFSGCELKSSNPPKTWATNECVHTSRTSVIVERPVERGVWGLTHLSAEQIVMPLSVTVDFEEPLDVATVLDSHEPENDLEESSLD
ncbi:hypothetical protein L218DRAFT_393216 [Marasmius fiardii PR-910]|nr:hypothetical protein L218DRAFT_393216 [Marasmius fiardii PR-910]